MPLLAVALASLLATVGSTAPNPPNKAPAPSGSLINEGAQQPQAKATDAEPPLTPAEKASQAAYEDYVRTLLFRLRHSDSPRDRAMTTQMWFLDDAYSQHEPTPADKAERGAMLRAAAEAAPDDVLVQWLWVEASPEDSGCSASNPCPHRLEAAARLQPDNGSTWVPVFSAAWTANDIPAAESALAKMARATYFDEQLGTAFKAWMEMYHRHPMPKLVFAPGSPNSKFDEQTVEFTSALAFAAAMAIPDYHGPIDACNRVRHPDASAQRLQDCAQVGRTMMVHSTSIIGRNLGRVLLRVSAQATAEDIANARVVDWQYEQWATVPLGPSDEEVRFLKEEASDWIETGDEIKALQRRMQRKGIPLVPPANWQPRGRDGKPINPLGEPPSSVQ